GGGVSTSGGARPGGSIDVAIGLDKKKGDLGVRTKSTLILVGSFLGIIIGLKQTGCAILVAFLQWAVFREGMAIVRDDVSELLLEAEKGGPKSLRRRQWGVFWVLGLAMYGKMLVKEIAGVTEPSEWMDAFCRWHVPACAALYVVSHLKSCPAPSPRNPNRYQLGQLSAAHLACFLVLPSALVSFSARGGLFWFVIASGSVIVNDIMAYICGRLFGRTSLTVLSPKKTWEGFVGAALCTSVAGWLAGRWLCGVCICSVMFVVAPVFPRSFYSFFSHSLVFCPQGDIFLKTARLPWLGLSVSRAEIHAFWIALMASLIGPFGGFFASGLKRAYGVKDFGDTIPGHGGAGDRFDCQVMLLPLVYFYLKAFAPGLDI
ncbi:unnamed protein product, partial [Scytosiphon promiscuus]